MVAPQERSTPAGEQETLLGRICSREMKERRQTPCEHKQTPLQCLCGIILSGIHWSTADGAAPLLQIAAGCCSGWWAERAWGSRPGHWAAEGHRGYGAVDGRSPRGVVV